MLSQIRAVFSSHKEDGVKQQSPKKKKPPGFKRNKHLRKRPSLAKKIWEFCKQRLRPKVIATNLAVLAGVIIIIAQVGYTYSPVEPIPFTNFEIARPNWTEDPYKMNKILWYCYRLRSFSNIWPTSVVTDKNNAVYLSTSNGAILAIEPSADGKIGEGKLDVLASGPVPNVTLPFGLTGPVAPHPVALRFTEGVGIVFALDPIYGLYAVSVLAKKATSILPLSGNGTGLISPTDFAVADGSADIYITDFSTKWSDYYLMNQVLEGTCTGRLLKYDIGEDKLKVLVSDLCGPVGVEIVANDTLLLVAEAGRPRIRRIELNTTTTTNLEPLPGLPGKIRRNPRGGCWLPVTKINYGFFDRVNPKLWLRRLLTGILPQSYLKSLATERHTIAAEVNPLGEVIDSLHDHGERKVHDVEEVYEHYQGQLLIVSGQNEHLAKLVGDGQEGKSRTAKERDTMDAAANDPVGGQEEHVFNPEPENFDMAASLLGEEKPRDKDEGEFTAEVEKEMARTADETASTEKEL